MTTLATHSRSILWGNDFNSNALGGSLISHKECEQAIRPSLNFTAKLLSFFQRSITNVRQIFNHNLSCSVITSPLDKSFRSNMYRMFGYGSLMSGHSFKKMSGGTSPNRLNFGSCFSDIGKFVVKMVCFIEQFFIRRGRNKKAIDPLIDTYNTPFRGWFWDFNFIIKIQIPLAIFKKYFRILPIARDWSRILKNNRVSPKSNSFFAFCKVTLPYNRNGFIFVNGKIPFFLSLHRFVSSRNRSEESTGKLGWKLKFFSDYFIVRLRKSVGVYFLRFENYFRKPVTGIKPIWKGLISFMLTREFKLYGSYCFHIG